MNKLFNILIAGLIILVFSSCKKENLNNEPIEIVYIKILKGENISYGILQHDLMDNVKIKTQAKHYLYSRLVNKGEIMYEYKPLEGYYGKDSIDFVGCFDGKRLKCNRSDIYRIVFCISDKDYYDNEPCSSN